MWYSPLHGALMGSQGGSCCGVVCTGKAVPEGRVTKGRDLSQSHSAFNLLQQRPCSVGSSGKLATVKKQKQPPPQKQNMQKYERTTLKKLDIRKKRKVTTEKRENDKVNPLIVPAHCLKFLRREEELRCRDLGVEKIELRVWGDQGCHRCRTQYWRRESCKESAPGVCRELLSVFTPVLINACKLPEARKRSTGRSRTTPGAVPGPRRVLISTSQSGKTL